MHHHDLLALGLGLGCWGCSRRSWGGACHQPGLRSQHYWVAALGRHDSGGREDLVRREAIGKLLAGTVGVDGGREVEFGSVIQFKGLYGGGFSSRAAPEKTGVGAPVESDGDSFR